VRTITIGDTEYAVRVIERDGQFVASASRAYSGHPFGIECAGATESAAEARLADWLNWQHEHAAALEALQQAERAYHRTVAGSAFASATEGPSAIEWQKESLELIEEARVRLDEVRARRPT